MVARKRLTHLATLVAVLSLGACSGGGGGADPGRNASGGPPTSPDGSAPAPPTLAALEIAPTATGGLRVSVGTPVQLTATATFSDATVADVTAEVVWASTNPSAAAFSTAAGSAGVLDPVAGGTTDVTATHPGGVAASVAVTVSPLPLYEDPTSPPLAIAPVNPTILIGTTMQFEASATLSDLSVVDYTAHVIWSTSDETVATISPTGQATAGGAVGTATITATDPVTGNSDGTTLTVTNVPAALGYVLLSRGSVVGGSASPVTGTVVLTSKASPTEPVTISLWASLWSSGDDAPIAEAEVPATVTVPANEDRATFDVTHHAVTRRTRIAVNAKDENPDPPIVKSSSLWLRPDR